MELTIAESLLLFNRKVRNKLPQLQSGHTDQLSDLGAKVKDNDDKAKFKMKTYADAKVRAKTSIKEVCKLYTELYFTTN